MLRTLNTMLVQLSEPKHHRVETDNECYQLNSCPVAIIGGEVESARCLPIRGAAQFYMLCEKSCT